MTLDEALEEDNVVSRDEAKAECEKLTLAIETRDALRAQGVKCQLRFVSGDLWNVLLAGTDY